MLDKSGLSTATINQLNINIMKKFQAYARLERWATLEVEAENEEAAYAKLVEKFNELSREDYCDEDEEFLDDSIVEVL